MSPPLIRIRRVDERPEYGPQHRPLQYSWPRPWTDMKLLGCGGLLERIY